MPSFIRDVESPLPKEVFEPLPDGAGTIQFSSLLSDAEFAAVAHWISERPETTLRAYGSYDGSIVDLEFLRHFPKLKRLAVDIPTLQDISGLGYLGDDLDLLQLGTTRKRFSMAPLRRFRSLHRLGLDGHKKDIEVISELQNLTSLGLQSITLADLRMLLPLQHLQALDISLGGTTDLSVLPEVGSLVFLHLWRVRGLEDLSAVGDVTTLEHLFLEALPGVTVVPTFHRTKLRKLHIEALKSLRDLGPLRSANSLREIFIADMAHLSPDDLEPLVGIPLERATIALGSAKKNAVIQQMFDLPPADRELHPALFS